MPARWPVRCARLPLAATVAAALIGCGTTTEVRPLATGRADLSAYALTGSDADGLRRTAQRLCPLGGEVLRQAMQAPRDAPAGRWRRTLDLAAQWAEPPPPASQLVVVCREPAERLRVPPASVAAAPAPAASATASAPRATSQDAEVSTAPPVPAMAALPIGPITPQW